MASGNLAEVPTVAYPAQNFFGAIGLTPQIQQGFQAAKPTVKPQSKAHVLITVGVLIALGYIAFHWNEVR